jgi:ubiquitin-like 1-activating enzyme E1 B
VLSIGPDKVFNTDILNLLSMADMWRSREKPTSLDFDAIMDGSFVVKEPSKSGAAPANSKQQPNGHINGDAKASISASQKGQSGLKDQRALSLQENLSLFVSRYGLDIIHPIPAPDVGRIVRTV